MAGVAADYTDRLLGYPHTGRPIEAAHDAMKRQMAEYSDAVLVDNAVAYRAALDERVVKGLTSYLADDPLAPYVILAVEHTLAAHGRARFDVALLDAEGLALVDVKTTISLGPTAEKRARALAVRSEEYRWSHQMRHYCWAYGEEIGQELLRYYILLVELEPTFIAHLLPYRLHPEDMALWLASAKQTWREMAAVEMDGPIRMSTSHESKYGPCEMKRACLHHHLDETLMMEDYTNGRAE